VHARAAASRTPALGNGVAAAPANPRSTLALTNMGTAALIIALLGMLGGAIWIAISAMQSTGDVAMSGHGYFAMALGIVFSLVVGIGLMSLVFFSHRKGYDDPAQRELRDQKADSPE
jgi:hypothetical protein